MTGRSRSTGDPNRRPCRLPIRSSIACWPGATACWRVRASRTRRRASLPTRLIARRRARALFDLVAGFTYSQVLFACVELGLFDLLLERPRPSSELAALARLDEERVLRLLAAATAIGADRTAGRRSLRSRPARCAVGRQSRGRRDGPPSRGPVPPTWPIPVALLRRSPAAIAPTGPTQLGAVWGYAANDDARALGDERVAAYSRLMSASQPLVAAQILDAYPLRRHHVLMDVGGGEGTFAIEVARRHPHLAVRVFDLPAVADRALARIEDAGLSPRIAAFGGDFVRDPLPAGADIVTLVRVVHDHDDAQALALLRAVHAALPADGILPARRADVRHERCRTDGRRLLRHVSARDGQWPATHAAALGGDVARGRLHARPADPDGPSAADAALARAPLTGPRRDRNRMFPCIATSKSRREPRKSVNSS